MDMPNLLRVLIFSAVLYAVGFGAAAVLLKALRGPWRRAAGAHWTDRARLAYAPGVAVLWFAALFPPVAAIVGGALLEQFDARTQGGLAGFLVTWLAAFAGVLTVRYRWLREAWGPRVTPRSWLAGCLVLVFLLMPHVPILMALLFLLPEAPNARAAGLMGAGVLATAFFALGGGVVVLRVLRVLRPASPQVTGMVQQLAGEMNVPGCVRVYELEWAQLNAVAWVLCRAVGFSRPLLAALAPDEVRAVAAHELAHLTEPPWVRTVRVAHLLSYLVIPPLVRYGGSGGLFGGLLLLMAIPIAYKRFTHRLEARADRLESEAVSDSDTYMRSMVRIHEGNLVPAVMPGTQSHPHLYDRLLAGGIEPDFPRPPAPSRAKPLLAAFAAWLCAVVVLIFIGGVATLFQRHQAIGPDHDPTADLPARFKTQTAAAKPDFSQLARDPKFQEAVREVSAWLNAQPQVLKSEADDAVIEGGVSFDVPAKKVEAFLFKAHTNFLARGYYLFRYRQNFGFQDLPDQLGFLPTRDKYAVMAAMDTNGDNYEIGTAGVIAWMKELESEQPFVLTGIGFDYMEGNFLSPVKDPMGLAERMYHFCPDIVDQGTGNLPALAKELRKGRLYFWWD